MSCELSYHITDYKADSSVILILNCRSRLLYLLWTSKVMPVITEFFDFVFISVKLCDYQFNFSVTRHQPIWLMWYNFWIVAYCGCSELKSWLGFWHLLSTSRQMLEYYPLLGQGHFVPHTLELIIHCLYSIPQHFI
jgi:hypothetical protein